ncbi:hypothetical protein BOQ60_23515 [Chryseobacterium sp. CH1]|nr:hypothetical protein BOQ60_23515 [Chryseobacterium sp. CH1]
MWSKTSIQLVIEIVEGSSKIKYFDSTIHHSKYINIDGGKIKILLPKNYVGNNFPQLMYDFLTNKNSVENILEENFLIMKHTNLLYETEL